MYAGGAKSASASDKPAGRGRGKRSSFDQFEDFKHYRLNVENALLEFKKVTNVKEQVVAGNMYHMTLEAADGGQKKVYEAKVWVKPWLNFKEVQEFKLVGDA